MAFYKLLMDELSRCLESLSKVDKVAVDEPNFTFDAVVCPQLLEIAHGFSNVGAVNQVKRPKP